MYNEYMTVYMTGCPVNCFVQIIQCKFKYFLQSFVLYNVLDFTFPPKITQQINWKLLFLDNFAEKS